MVDARSVENKLEGVSDLIAKKAREPFLLVNFNWAHRFAFGFLPPGRVA